MPITYTIDHAKGLITETWSGDVAVDDLASYWRRYMADPAVLAIRRTLVDLRQSTIRFTGLQLAELVATIAIPVLDGRDWKTALVVDREVQFGISRQYQVFAESYSRDAIFFNPDEAMAWLLS